MVLLVLQVSLPPIKSTFWLVQVVSVYIAGEAVGAFTQTFVGDKLGRIRFMQSK